MIVRDKSNRLKLLFVWRGTVLPKVLPLVLALMAISMVAWGLTHYKVYAVTGVPAVGFTVFGVVLSIFLGFRNTACYERWWEGRKLWGAMIANTRHLTRDSHFLPNDERKQLLIEMLLFVGLLRNRLRGQTADRAQFAHFHDLADDELDALNHHVNAPQVMLEKMQLRLMRVVQTGQVSDIVYTSIQRHVIEMGNIQAGCDRIASTPLPFPYSVLLHRAVFCFCWMLPFGLESVMGIWTPFLVGFLSYLLLGLDELSHQLEEPFGTADNDLPLDTMVRLMERETLSLLDLPLPAPINADASYNFS